MPVLVPEAKEGPRTCGQMHEARLSCSCHRRAFFHYVFCTRHPDHPGDCAVDIKSASFADDHRVANVRITWQRAPA